MSLPPAARVLVAVGVLLVSGEVLTRLFICGPSPQQYDPEIGYTYRPHSELFQAKEGVTRLRFNALGLNNDDLGPKDGRCRLLVIGDSYTAALEVPRAENFMAVAERIDRRLEVVNAGRDGLYLGDMHKMFERLSGPVHPDLTVYVISQRAVETDIELPEFRLRIDPASGVIRDAVMHVEAKERFKELLEPLVQHSALATRAAAQAKPLFEDTAAQLAKWRALAHGRSGQDGAPPVGVRPAREAVLAFVFGRLARSGPAALLYLDALSYRSAHSAQVAPTSARAELLAREAAARAGVPFFDAADELIDEVARTGQPPYGFHNSLRPGGHLNDLGHAAVGRSLAALVHAMEPQLPGGCAVP